MLTLVAVLGAAPAFGPGAAVSAQGSSPTPTMEPTQAPVEPAQPLAEPATAAPTEAPTSARMQPSPRGELEITDLNRMYLERGRLRVEVLGRGVAWLDAGTHESLHQSASFVQAVQERQGLMICCPEEIAYGMGYITVGQLRALAGQMADNAYAVYLRRLADEGL